MDIKLELLTNQICDTVRNNIKNIEIDTDRIVNTTAIRILYEIQHCIKNDKLSDFEVVESIVTIFEKYGIDTGARHDF